MAHEKANKTGKKYHLELSLTSIFFWSLGIFFVLGWIFVLGILVGRGFLSDEVKNFTELKSKVTRLQEMISDKKKSDLDHIKELGKDPEFTFYDELSKKQDEVPKKNIPTIKKEPEKKTAKKTEPVAKKKELAKTPVKKKQSHETGPRYTVQIASLDSEYNAIRMVNQMLARGHPAFYTKADVKGRTYFRVRCGKFKTKKEADTFKLLLIKKGNGKGFVTLVN